MYSLIATDWDVQQVPLWSCGDPLKYPVPREDGDLWDKLLKPLLERDKQQCDAWRDEVENLLIFVSQFFSTFPYGASCVHSCLGRSLLCGSHSICRRLVQGHAAGSKPDDH